MSMPSLKYSGATHVALRFFQMKRGTPATSDDVLRMFPNKFSKPSRVKETLEVLSKNRLISFQDNGWVITTNGSEYLRVTAGTYKGG